MKTRLLAIACVALAAVLVVVLLATPACVKQPAIKLGVPYPMTGPYAADGVEIIAGVTLAVEEINAQGGLLGRPLEVLMADTKALAPEDVDAAAKLLAQQGVEVFIAGYANYPACLTFGKYDILYLSFDANTAFRRDFLADREEYWNVFQVGGVEALHAINAFETITKRPPYHPPNKKAAIVSVDAPYFSTIAKAFEKVATEGGWEIVLHKLHPWGTTEFGAELAKIRKENPSIIFASFMDVASVRAFMDGFLRNPTQSIVYFEYAPGIPEFLQVLGDSANGIVWTIVLAYLPNDRGQAFVQRFKERLRREPGFSTPSTLYDTVNIWAQGVRNAGSLDQRAIAKAILANPYEGVNGKYVFSPEDQYAISGDDLPIHFVQIQNGKQVLLFLEDKPQAKFQTPPWIKL